MSKVVACKIFLDVFVFLLGEFGIYFGKCATILVFYGLLTGICTFTLGLGFSIDFMLETVDCLGVKAGGFI